MRKTYLLGFVLLTAHIVLAKHYLPVEAYTVNNGLSHSEITCLFQDKTGFLWIGTKNGLNRFDGLNFFKYPVDLSDSMALPGTSIIRLFEDAQNNLWVVSSNGLSRYNKEQDNFRTYYIFDESKGRRISIQLKDAAIDWKRNVILILGEGYFGKLDINNEEITAIPFFTDPHNEAYTNLSSVIYNGLYNAFFIYGSKTILRLDTEGDSLCTFSPEVMQILENLGGIRGLVNGINGECLVYSKDHLYLFEEVSRLKEINIQSLIKDKEIIEVFQNSPEILFIVTNSSVIRHSLLTSEDRELFSYDLPYKKGIITKGVLYTEPGIFWIGTSDGLYKFNYYKNYFVENRTDDYFTTTGSLIALSYDTDDLLWLANNAGEVIVLGAQGKDVKARDSKSYKITVLKNDPYTNHLFMGTDEGLYSLKLKNEKNIEKKLIVPGVIDNFCCYRDTIWIVHEGILSIASTDNKFETVTRNLKKILQGTVIDMFCTQDAIFLLQPNQIVRYERTDSSSVILTLLQLNLNVLPENICFLPLSEKELIVGTTSGLFVYYLYDLRILPSYLNITGLTEPVHAIFKFSDEHLWISSNHGIVLLNKPKNTSRCYSISDGLSMLSFSDRLIDMDNSGMMCIGSENHFVLFRPDSVPVNRRNPNIEITGIELFDHDRTQTIHVFGVDTISIETRYKYIMFTIAALDFWDPGKNMYYYSLQRAGEPDYWIELGTKNSFYYPSRLKVGDYILKIKGSNNDGIWCKEPRVLVLHMVAPWWRTKMAIFSCLALFFLLIYLIILFTTRQLRRINRQYREKEFIARKVEMQKEELTMKNKNITDSINYAKRIQMALMPSQKIFKKFFPDSFIFHMPKDIVSGDFYWINEVDGRIYFAAVDCTGHGVPGAFMSIIGFELFRRITEIEKKKQPAEILKSLNQGFESIFRDIENIVLRDGMDVAFCAIDPELKVLEYSGAFNPLYLIRDNTITEIKGDRFSVGLNQLDLAIPTHPFNDHVIPLKEGDIIYIFTDGYADQFGGPEGKKYKYRRFRHLLLALHQLPMDRQLEFLRRSILDWKGDLDQVDDILVMGIRISHKGNSENNVSTSN
jgi:serine phosphatase RsbU (regulator of sigma subunit)/ligand-binding sensor domain-containing protein